MAKIYVVYYSTYGHVYAMANAIKEGIDAVEGCEAVLYQVRRFAWMNTGLRMPPSRQTRASVQYQHPVVWRLPVPWKVSI